MTHDIVSGSKIFIKGNKTVSAHVHKKIHINTVTQQLLKSKTFSVTILCIFDDAKTRNPQCTVVEHVKSYSFIAGLNNIRIYTAESKNKHVTALIRSLLKIYVLIINCTVHTIFNTVKIVFNLSYRDKCTKVSASKQNCSFNIITKSYGFLAHSKIVGRSTEQDQEHRL